MSSLNKNAMNRRETNEKEKTNTKKYAKFTYRGKKTT
jgi:hypothetical protein